MGILAILFLSFGAVRFVARKRMEPGPKRVTIIIIGTLIMTALIVVVVFGFATGLIDAAHLPKYGE